MKMIQPVQFYKKMSAAMRTSIWFTICNFLQRGTAFITVPIFTRLLTKDQYGLYNVYLAWFDIFVLITSLKLPYEGLNNGLIRYEEDKDRYTSSIAGLILTMTSVWGVIYLVIHKWVDAMTGFSSLVMVFMFIEVAFNPPLFLWTNRERFDFRYRWPIVVSILMTILNPAISIVAVLNTSYKAEARIIATSSLQAILGFILLFVLFKRGKCFYNKTYWKFAITFNVPLLFFYLSQSLLSQADRLMINYYTGTGDAGVYSVAYSAATLVLLVISAINGSFNPWMYKKLKAGEFSEIRSVSTTLCVFVGAATLGMSTFAPDLIRLLATGDYYQAIWVIPPVSASVYFIFTYMIFANVEMYYGETKYISLISIVSSLANLGLNAIFIPMFGYYAAGWTTLVCYMLLTVLHYILMKKTCAKHQVPEAVFRDQLLLLISGGVLALSTAVLFVYGLGWLRYVILFLGAVGMYLCRNRLIALWKRMKTKKG